MQRFDVQPIFESFIYVYLNSQQQIFFQRTNYTANINIKFKIQKYI